MIGAAALICMLWASCGSKPTEASPYGHHSMGHDSRLLFSDGLAMTTDYAGYAMPSAEALISRSFPAELRSAGPLAYSMGGHETRSEVFAGLRSDLVEPVFVGERVYREEPVLSYSTSFREPVITYDTGFAEPVLAYNTGYSEPIVGHSESHHEPIVSTFVQSSEPIVSHYVAHAEPEVAHYSTGYGY